MLYIIKLTVQRFGMVKDMFVEGLNVDIPIKPDTNSGSIRTLFDRSVCIT